jgi:thiosulfate/3-mercaptopyruvate sulfurtransferase
MKDMMLELPDAPTLRATVSRFGISDDSRVVVYFGGEGLVQSATRIVFTLDYLGLGARTSLLNGGLGAWKRAGKAVTGVVPAEARGNLATRTHENLVADAAFVSSVPSRQGYKLIDARAPSFYKDVEPTMNGKAGHIRGRSTFRSRMSPTRTGCSIATASAPVRARRRQAGRHGRRVLPRG